MAYHSLVKYHPLSPFLPWGRVTLETTPVKQLGTPLLWEAQVWQSLLKVKIISTWTLLLHNFWSTYYADPALSAVITASGQPGEGQNYSLTCEVRGDEQLAVSSSTLQWDKDGREYSHNLTLTFNPLRLDDAGEYRCISTLFSPYLIGSRTVMTQITLICKWQKFSYKQLLQTHRCECQWQWWCTDSWQKLHTHLYNHWRRHQDTYLPMVEKWCSIN